MAAGCIEISATRIGVITISAALVCDVNLPFTLFREYDGKIFVTSDDKRFLVKV